MENTEWLDKLKSHISCQGTGSYPARGQVRDSMVCRPARGQVRILPGDRFVTVWYAV